MDGSADRLTLGGPRRVHCVLDTIPSSSIKPGNVAPDQNIPCGSVDNFSSFPSSSNHRVTSMSVLLEGPQEGALVLKNKAPRWHGQLHCWCLNFHGRVTVASVKNFQLGASPEHGCQPGLEHKKVILQFGKLQKDVFTMDYRYPISAFETFAICLSSFDTKIACE